MRLIVRTPARLHLGFIDLNGECGRLFGSLGVALERPGYALEAAPSRRCEAEGPGAEEALRIVARLRPHLPPMTGVSIRILEAIPRHAGLGAGTQLELATAFALSRLLDDRRPVPELAALAGRGKRSGIGIAAFERGGFAVDAGHRDDASREGRRPAGDDVPPVVFQHPVPDDWFFVVATPYGVEGLSGKREEAVFAQLPRMPGHTAGRISRLVLMKVMPALMTDDIEAFGDGITEIQALVGLHFAPYQGGTYATEIGRQMAELALKRGAHGVGQSSWGPTVFALERGLREAQALRAELTDVLGPGGGSVLVTRASARGVAWRAER